MSIEEIIIDGVRMAGIKTLRSKLKRLEQENAELKAENDRLKEEVETRDNLVEHFRKEAINWAKISNDCIKDIENYKQTLQEIKEIAEKLMADNLCNNCDGIGLDANCQDTGCPYYQMDKILQKITKAEEE